MKYPNRKYVILNTNEIDSIDFTQILNVSKIVLRYSNDNTKTFVKYEGTQPSFLSGKTEYTHSEILAILNDIDGDWYTAPTE
jgi:hypothetical protein|tara:strand:+ start:889 stop:1134 length:246 start_codon:yes stop_codon:yes gene_type:complete